LENANDEIIKENSCKRTRFMGAYLKQDKKLRDILD
jgi:hypothetical protein